MKRTPPRLFKAALLLSLAAVTVDAQQEFTIGTVAGCDCSQPNLGDGGPAKAAQITADAVALDTAGNLYIADTGNNRIRKVSTNGTISTVAGNGLLSFSAAGDGGPALVAELGNPSGVAVDAAGDIYISDFESARIRKVTSDGTIRTVAGGGDGTCSGSQTNSIGDGCPAVNAKLGLPYGIALDAAGNLYIILRIP